MLPKLQHQVEKEYNIQKLETPTLYNKQKNKTSKERYSERKGKRHLKNHIRESIRWAFKNAGGQSFPVFRTDFIDKLAS